MGCGMSKEEIAKYNAFLARQNAERIALDAQKAAEKEAIAAYKAAESLIYNEGWRYIQEGLHKFPESILGYPKSTPEELEASKKAYLEGEKLCKELKPACDAAYRAQHQRYIENLERLERRLDYAIERSEAARGRRLY